MLPFLQSFCYACVVEILQQKFARHFSILAVTVVLVVLIFGVSHIGMAPSPDGRMSACPLMGIVAVCRMNLFEHITAWQSMFAALPAKEIVFLLALTFLLFLVPFIFLPVAVPGDARQHPFVFETPFQKMFSNGILHPKIF